MDKKKMSEADIRSKFITPAVLGAGWDLQTQMREEFTLTKGRIIVSGQLHTRDLGKHKAQRADYVLFYKPNIPIAVIEAKDNKNSVGGGMQQALGYAHTLDVPFVFSSNGDAFLFRNNLKSEGVLEKEIRLEDFPSPEQLWAWWMADKGLTTHQAELVTQDYYGGGTGKTPRYYQLLAINKTTEAIARGQNRILLVMATGTGKTFTAFQIIWRLWQARAKKRILFLADRNILIDQTMTNDFKPFSPAMTKISKGEINTAYEIYLSLYQAMAGTEEAPDIYKEFSPDFFDLIVVDECHRGSAAEDSNWRRILEYFSAATQIGLTATPKETKEVSDSDYFGQPLYTYSLRQGIEDGFLAPYKVVRIHLDTDLAGWTPQPGQLDKYGHPIEQRVYNERDFDRILVLEERTKLVARKVSEYLKATNRYDKTIVFCEDIDHAERMRQALVNENADLVAESDRYVVRITGDSKEGKAELDNFIFPESRYPAIATTSKLMSTGVDAQTCKVIVLDKRIESMTEFKQIIGRGTRVKEEYGKYFFTILDFKGATAKFADPEFDGDPVQVYVPGQGDSLVPPVEPGLIPDDSEPDWDSGLEGGDTTPVRKYYVAGGTVTVIGEQIMYYNAENQPVTESLMAYTRRTLGGEFASLDDFLKRWNAAERKGVIIDELQKQGIIFEALSDQVSDQVGSQLDPFDLICHLVWNQPPLTRHERAANVKKRDVFTKYGPQAQRVLDALLDKYADQGVEPLEQVQILKIDPFRQFGTPLEIVRGFGGKAAYEQAIRDLETELYTAS